jgi:hypothetical protein
MTGEHVFVDASDNCNSLDFTLGDNAIDIAAIATRSVSIKVSLIGLLFVCLFVCFLFVCLFVCLFVGDGLV